MGAGRTLQWTRTRRKKQEEKEGRDMESVG